MPILVASQQVVPIARGSSCQPSKIARLVCSELEAGCCAQVMKPASPGQAAPPGALLSPDLEKCGGWTTCAGWRVCILVCWSLAALSALLPLPVGLELTAGVESQLVGSQQFLHVPCTGRAAGIDSDSLLASTDLHAVTRFVMDVFDSFWGCSRFCRSPQLTKTCCQHYSASLRRLCDVMRLWLCLCVGWLATVPAGGGKSVLQEPANTRAACTLTAMLNSSKG